MVEAVRTLDVQIVVNIQGDEPFLDPNVVKVVTDLDRATLYFSRSLIPYPRKREARHGYEHSGLYAYRYVFCSSLPNGLRTRRAG